MPLFLTLYKQLTIGQIKNFESLHFFASIILFMNLKFGHFGICNNSFFVEFSNLNCHLITGSDQIFIAFVISTS